ncbi:hypothetical protein AB4Y43_16710 [Paraburkholderia sp. BR10872]|uniref:hypothetical protein n=1 Tax=Paraburkholderia sp. BR10872 TaxID=3236989 RepID=UPI0034D1FDFB
MMLIKQLVLAVVAAAPFACHAGERETTLKYATHMVSYVAARPDGGLQVQAAWEGYEVVKRETGLCYRIDHTNLRIENVGSGQRAQFDETVTPVPCG